MTYGAPWPFRRPHELCGTMSVDLMTMSAKVGTLNANTGDLRPPWPCPHGVKITEIYSHFFEKNIR